MAGHAARRAPPSGRLLLNAATGVVLLFLVAPILVVFPLSLSSGELLVLPPPGWSLRWYEDFFTSRRWLSATWNSFVVGGWTMALATTLGTLAAIGIHLGRFRGKAALVAALSLPIVTPVIVTAIALYFALALVGLGSTLTSSPTPCWPRPMSC
jgi:putative spermidine/putrescine transport system permease protein